MRTVTIQIWREGQAANVEAVVLAEKSLARYYGVSGDRFRCFYVAKIVQTVDGQLWLNHPKPPHYPEEHSGQANDWREANQFPDCIVGLPELMSAALASADYMVPVTAEGGAR